MVQILFRATHERFVGGQTVKKQYPLDTLPVDVRAGSIVPMGPALQYAVVSLSDAGASPNASPQTETFVYAGEPIVLKYNR